MTKSNLIFQPKGTNEANEEALKRYSRILVNVERGSTGDFYQKDEKFNFTKSEVQEINSIMKNQLTVSLQRNNIQILEWYPMEFSIVNEMRALKISYLRQLSDRDPVFVNMYKFFDDDRMTEITLSYRQSEEKLWKYDFEKVVNTIQVF